MHDPTILSVAIPSGLTRAMIELGACGQQLVHACVCVLHAPCSACPVCL